MQNRSRSKAWVTGLAAAAAASLATLALGAAPAGAKPAVDPQTPVASDGSTVAVNHSASLAGGVSGFAGTGSKGADSGVTATANGATSGPNAGAVIGADTRFRINPTTGFPNRATVLITFTGGRCTGWLFDDNTVATAGHCVHSGGSGGAWRSGFTIYPGYNGSSGAPYGSCGWTTAYSVTGWTVDGNEEYDYGAIKLNCTIGNTVGWYGYWWQSASLTGLSTTIYGYPGDKPLEQWGSTGSVAADGTRKVFYQNDTAAGDSGAPVHQFRSSGSSFCTGYCTMGIHAYAPHGSGSSATNNSATRITEGVFNNLQAWAAA